MVRRRRIFGNFLRPLFPASRVQQISDLHLKFALGLHTMCRSMVDIQSAIAEIRRGKKEEEERKKEEDTTSAKYNVRICCAGRP